jgi:hypothetical protein
LKDDEGRMMKEGRKADTKERKGKERKGRKDDEGRMIKGRKEGRKEGKGRKEGRKEGVRVGRKK